MNNLFKKLFTNNVETTPSKALIELKAIQERNTKRMEAIKESMGSRYLLHPDNTKSRLNEPRPV